MINIYDGDSSSRGVDEKERSTPSSALDAGADTSQTGQEASFPTRVENLNTELAKYKKEVEALTSRCERFKQDFNNYRDRTKKNEKKTEMQIRQEMNTRLLVVIDALDRAGDFDLDKRGKKESGKILTDVRSNLGITRNKMLSILDIQSIEVSPGDIFDGEKHVALDIVDSDSYSDNAIVKVIRKGYLSEGKILRAAEVSLSKYTGPPSPVARDTFLHRAGRRIRSFFMK